MTTFTRRSLLLAGTVALPWSKSMSQTPSCTLAAEQEEGPYYIDESALRRNITEGKPGVALQLRVLFVDAKRCVPIEHAAVDVWHCDALGVYSGFSAMSPDGPTGGRGPLGPRPGEFPPPGFDPRNSPPPRPRQLDANRFLRGTQLSDRRGGVEFATVYPGWYSGRAIHIHLKVHLGSHVCHTGQLFFPEEITADIAKLEPYVSRLRVHRTAQSEDHIFTGQHGSESSLDLLRLKNGSNEAGFIASVTLGIDPEATPPAMRPFGPGGPPPPRSF